MKNILIDLDGTVLSDIPNEQVHLMSDAIPFDGAVESVKRLYETEGNTVTFFTSRTEDMREITETWLNKWGFPYHGLMMNKPRGGNYIWIDNLEVEYLNYPRDISWSDGALPGN